MCQTSALKDHFDLKEAKWMKMQLSDYVPARAIPRACVCNGVLIATMIVDA